MTSKSDDVTRANRDAKAGVDGRTRSRTKHPEDGKSVTEVNEAANAEFNDDKQPEGLGDQVGGLRGSPD